MPSGAASILPPITHRHQHTNERHERSTHFFQSCNNAALRKIEWLSTHKSVITDPSSQTSRRESGPALLIYQKTKAVGPERVRSRTPGLKATRMRGQPAHTPGLQSPSSARRAGSDTTGKPADNQQWSRRMTRGVSVDVDHAPRGASLGGDVTHKMHPSGAETIV